MVIISFSSIPIEKSYHFSYLGTGFIIYSGVWNKKMSSDELKNSELFKILYKNGDIELSKKGHSPITQAVLDQLKEYVVEIGNKNRGKIKVPELIYKKEDIRIPDMEIPNIGGSNKGLLAYIGNRINRGFNPYNENKILKHMARIAYNNQKKELKDNLLMA